MCDCPYKPCAALCFVYSHGGTGAPTPGAADGGLGRSYAGRLGTRRHRHRRRGLHSRRSRVARSRHRSPGTGTDIQVHRPLQLHGNTLILYEMRHHSYINSWPQWHLTAQESISFLQDIMYGLYIQSQFQHSTTIGHIFTRRGREIWSAMTRGITRKSRNKDLKVLNVCLMI